MTDAIVQTDEITFTRAPTANQEVEITNYAPNEMTAQGNVSANGYLVFSEAFVPGWRAFVNEQEVGVTRANHLFRAIPITAGAHQVRMIYEPLSFRIGAIISIITGLSVAATFVVLLLKRQNKK